MLGQFMKKTRGKKSRATVPLTAVKISANLHACVKVFRKIIKVGGGLFKKITDYVSKIYQI
jgi:hypothetical protein